MNFTDVCAGLKKGERYCHLSFSSDEYIKISADGNIRLFNSTSVLPFSPNVDQILSDDWSVFEAASSLSEKDIVSSSLLETSKRTVKEISKFVVSASIPMEERQRYIDSLSHEEMKCVLYKVASCWNYKTK